MLVIRGAYIRGAYIRGAYIRDFTVLKIPPRQPPDFLVRRRNVGFVRRGRTLLEKYRKHFQ